MKKEGICSGRIAAKFNLGSSTVRNYSVGIGPKSHHKIPENIPITREKARIHAALASEGYQHISRLKFYRSPIILKGRLIGYKSKPLKKISIQKRLIFTNQNKSFLNKFKNDVKFVYGYYPFKNKEGELGVSGQIAKDLFKLGKYGSKNWRVPNEIMFNRLKIKREWLKIFFDAESSVEYDLKQKHYRIIINSVNRSGLGDVQKLLKSFNIKSNISGPYKGYYRLTISRKENVTLYYKWVGFYLISKQRKLKEIIDRYD